MNTQIWTSCSLLPPPPLTLAAPHALSLFTPAVVTKAVCQSGPAPCQTEAASSIGHRSLPEETLGHRSHAFLARQGSDSIVLKGASTHYWQRWGVGRGACLVTLEGMAGNLDCM
jgi:hypothetical protein